MIVKDAAKNLYTGNIAWKLKFKKVALSFPPVAVLGKGKKYKQLPASANNVNWEKPCHWTFSLSLLPSVDMIKTVYGLMADLHYITLHYRQC